MDITELKTNGFTSCLKAWGDTNGWFCIKKLKFLYCEEDFLRDISLAYKVFNKMCDNKLFISGVKIEFYPIEDYEIETTDIDSIGYDNISGKEIHFKEKEIYRVVTDIKGCELGNAILILTPYGVSANSSDSESIVFSSGEKIIYACHFCDILYALIYLYCENADIYKTGNLNALKRSGMIISCAEFETHLQSLIVAPSEFNDKIPNEVRFRHYENLILDALDKAKVSIFVAVAWISNKHLADKLKEKHDQGLDVQILINKDGINRNILPDFGQIKVYAKRGDRGGIMHNKFCIIDNQRVLHGSYNWTNNAENRNDETLSTENNLNVVSDYTIKFKELLKNAENYEIPHNND